MKVIVTGVAGFIGFHVAQQLLSDGIEVFGVDSLNSYYDPKLKHDRKSLLELYGNQFTFIQSDLYTSRILDFSCDPQAIIHLAAQAGVRYSTKNPKAYIDSNIVGTFNILEYCRLYRVPLLYASSSSVYGGNQTPWQEDMKLDSPESLYAASKISNEVMVESYVNMFNLKAVGFRFFTVYGPWGRPDMAYFIFTRAIVEGKPIKVFNHGKMQRDFTYIDDIVEGVVRVLDIIPGPDPEWKGEDPDPGTSLSPYRLFNIGNNNPVELMDFIEAIERALGKKAVKEFLPLQPGDVLATYADVDDLIESVGFKPETSIFKGIEKFVDWYLDYYNNY